MQEMSDFNSSRSINSFDNDWKFLTQQMQGMDSSDTSATKAPEKMNLIPRNKEFHFSANGTEQEPIHDSNYTTKDVQFPWEQHP